MDCCVCHRCKDLRFAFENRLLRDCGAEQAKQNEREDQDNYCSPGDVFLICSMVNVVCLLAFVIGAWIWN